MRTIATLVRLHSAGNPGHDTGLWLRYARQVARAPRRYDDLLLCRSVEHRKVLLDDAKHATTSTSLYCASCLAYCHTTWLCPCCAACIEETA